MLVLPKIAYSGRREFGLVELIRDTGGFGDSRNSEDPKWGSVEDAGPETECGVFKHRSKMYIQNIETLYVK